MSLSRADAPAQGARRSPPLSAVVHSLDPRTRILTALVMVAVIVGLHSMWGKLAALLAAAAFVFASISDLRLVMRRLAHVEGFMIVLLLMLPFTVPGAEIARIGAFTVSDRGLMRAVSIILTVNAAVLVVLALLATLEPVRLARGLGALGLPAGLTQLLFFLVRYLGIFREELARSYEAMRARGFAPRVNRHTLRSYGNLAGMLLVRSIERAERVEEAMRCRGFAGRFPLRSVRAFGSHDRRFGAAAACTTVLLLVGDRLL